MLASVRDFSLLSLGPGGSPCPLNTPLPSSPPIYTCRHTLPDLDLATLQRFCQDSRQLQTNVSTLARNVPEIPDTSHHVRSIIHSICPLSSSFTATVTNALVKTHRGTWSSHSCPSSFAIPDPAGPSKREGEMMKFTHPKKGQVGFKCMSRGPPASPPATPRFFCFFLYKKGRLGQEQATPARITKEALQEFKARGTSEQRWLSATG
jgi:hypothetical protein